MNARHKAVIVLDLIGRELTEEAIQDYLASGDPRPLPSTEPEEDVIGGQCEQCGTSCEPGDNICYHCDFENAQVEARVNEFMEGRGE